MTNGAKKRRWPGQRLAALLLSVSLMALGVYSLAAGVREYRVLLWLGTGTFLGLLYVVRGGTLPEVVYRLSRRFGEGAGITRDDDPQNLPAKMYLLVLLLAVGRTKGVTPDYRRRKIQACAIDS